MRRMPTLVILLLTAGCTATAIIPAKVTYTYPLNEPIASYETPAEVGAVAYLDNGSMELYLPCYSPDPAKPAPFKPKRFVFTKTTAEGIWQERKDPEFTLRMILKKEQLTASGSSEIITNLNDGMLLVTFPSNSERYGIYAGKRIWLTSTAGADEIFKVRGIYWKSKATYEDMTK
jgi:hypothetical protein